MKRKLAFFDVDGTLYKVSTTHDVLNYLNSLGLIDPKFHKEYWDWDVEYRNGIISYQEVVHKGITSAMKSFNGLNVIEIENIVKDYFIQHHKILPYAKPVVDFLLEQNFEIYIISAGIYPAIKAIADILNIPNYFSSTQLIIDNTYTDQVNTILHSEDKKKIVHEVINNIDNDSIKIGFGDTTGDADMLSMMDLSFAIDPHQQEMRDLSNANGWTITSDAVTIIDKIKPLL